MIKADAITLFSGGLDSVLAARLLQGQGLAVRCLHFYSPFFGDPGAVERWQEQYGLEEVLAEDVSDDFTAMLLAGPAHGFGKVLNPCVDCKILLLRRALRHMRKTGASFLASGEVLGQRPMSQRRDTLNIIQREAGVAGILLRPLCARHLEPTRPELEGMVRREELLDISGRGRSPQLELAARLGLGHIPAPGGGCLLTEKENARSFYPLLRGSPSGRAGQPADAADFRLALTGRQFWAREGGSRYWLIMGRRQADNEALERLVRPGDTLLKVARLPGPLGLARGGSLWPQAMLAAAAALCASYSPRALAAGGPVRMRLLGEGQAAELAVDAQRQGPFRPPDWESAREALRLARKERAALQKNGAAL